MTAVQQAFADRGYEIEWVDGRHAVVRAMTFAGHRDGAGADLFVETRGELGVLRFTRRQTSVGFGLFSRGLLFRGGSTFRHLRRTVTDGLEKAGVRVLEVNEG